MINSIKNEIWFTNLFRGKRLSEKIKIELAEYFESLFKRTDELLPKYKKKYLKQNPQIKCSTLLENFIIDTQLKIYFAFKLQKISDEKIEQIVEEYLRKEAMEDLGFIH